MTTRNQTVQTDDGVSIAYKTLGEGPRTLLFSHGWGGASSGFFWQEMLAHLDLGGLRIVLVDARGHGESEKVTTGFTSERFAQDMFAVADAVGAEQVVLVGYSLSGRPVQWMACTQPERVIGQILIAPVPAADIPFPDEVRHHWLEAVQQRELFEPLARQWCKEPLRSDLFEAYFTTVSTTPQFSLNATLDMCTSAGTFTDKLQATRAPTLVIGGQYDGLLPLDFVRQAIVQAIPGARLATLDCGHEIPLEKPQETAALFEAFLAGLR
jgi:pimeloyl-ACP methyl ester carboxylesterase